MPEVLPLVSQLFHSPSDAVCLSGAHVLNPNRGPPLSAESPGNKLCVQTSVHCFFHSTPNLDIFCSHSFTQATTSINSCTPFILLITHSCAQSSPFPIHIRALITCCSLLGLWSCVQTALVLCNPLLLSLPFPTLCHQRKQLPVRL